MSYRRILIAYCLICGAGCALKPVRAEDTGKKFSAKLIETKTEHQVDKALLEMARALFSKNKLDLKELQLYKFNTDEYGTSHAVCNQLYQGVLVLHGDVGFHFGRNDELKFETGTRLKDLKISIEPKVSMENACKAIEAANLNNHVGQKLFKTSTYFAQLVVYHDVLAWKVLNGSEKRDIEYVVIDASTSKILYFDDGIRF